MAEEASTTVGMRFRELGIVVRGLFQPLFNIVTVMIECILLLYEAIHRQAYSLHDVDFFEFAKCNKVE